MAAMEMSIYDGKCKDWTWEMHLASVRGYFEHLDNAGQEQIEEMKVKMLMASIQCEDLSHLSTSVEANPWYRTSFEAASAFRKVYLTVK